MVKAANSTLFSLFLLLCLAIAVPAMAQKPDPMFYKEIQLTHKPYTLHSLSREMQRQSGITFSYNAAKISANQKIKIKDRKLTVEQLLALVKRKAGIGYKIVSSNHIVYMEGPKKKGLFARKKDAKKTKRKEQPVRATQPAVAAAPSNNNMVKEPVRQDTAVPGRIVIVGDSSLAMGYYFSGGGNSGGAYNAAGIAKAPGEQAWTDPYLDLNAPTTTGAYSDSKTAGFFKKNILVAVGASADEIYYFNPSVRAGFSFLYGTVSYNLGSSPHWRYGLGTSARINDKWNMHLAFNTGKKIPGEYNLVTIDTIPSNFPDSFPPTITQTTHPISIKSKLTRFSLQLEYQLTKDVTLSGAATFNYLSTEYSSNGAPVQFDNFKGSTTADPDNEFRLIKPPYLLGNSYSGTNSTNSKIWIGLQLSLFYRIPFFGQ